MEENKKFEHLLAFHCAPTLAGIKAASLVTVQKRKVGNFFALLQQYQKCLNCKGIYFEVLSETTNYVLVYVYRKNSLVEILSAKENQELLQAQGYKNTQDLEDCLSCLKARLLLRKTFPHEIGLFLGYPLADVQGFIENQGQKFKLSGSWKVYSDVDTARQLFDSYARCSEKFCHSLNNGGMLEELTIAV